MGPALMKSGLILVRHAPVADRYRGLCYGQSDVEPGPMAQDAVGSWSNRSPPLQSIGCCIAAS